MTAKHDGRWDNENLPATTKQERLSVQERPKRIIPFAVTKEDCKKAYIRKLRRSLFAPKETLMKCPTPSFFSMPRYRSYSLG